MSLRAPRPNRRLLRRVLRRPPAATHLDNLGVGAETGPQLRGLGLRDGRASNKEVDRGAGGVDRPMRPDVVLGDIPTMGECPTKPRIRTPAASILATVVERGIIPAALGRVCQDGSERFSEGG